MSSSACRGLRAPFAFLFCLATAPCPSGHFRVSRKARTPFHEILPVPARADIGGFRFSRLSSSSALPLGSLQNFVKGKGRLSTKFFQCLSEAHRMWVMQSLRQDVAFLDCLPLRAPFPFLLCLATAPCPSGHFRISRKARSPFHEILPVPARADIGTFAFLLVYHSFLVFGCLAWCE